MVGDTEFDPIREFEKREKELFQEHKEKLKCLSQDGKCTGTFVSKGRGGNSTANGMKRLQIMCKTCKKAVGLHLALGQIEVLEVVAQQLQHMYENAAGFRPPVTSCRSEEKTQPTEASVGMDVDGEESGFTSDSDDEDAAETAKDPVKVSRPTTKRAFMPTPLAPRQSSRKMFAMAVPSGMKRGWGCGKECEGKIAEMSALLKAYAQETAALRETVVGQNAMISELSALVRAMVHEGARTTNSPPVQTTAPPVGEKKASAPKVAADKVRTESEAQPNAQQQPNSNESTPLSNEKGKVPSFVEVTKRFIPAKEYRELKRCAVPFKAPTRVVKLHFRFSWRKDMERGDAFQLARKMLAAANVKDVLEVSFIGRSILEVFVEDGKADMVKSAMRKWCDGVDTSLTQSEIDNFPQGRLAAEDILTKKVSRATFLCARNRTLPMQDCILRDIDQALHAKIMKEAEDIRKQWASSDDAADAAKPASTGEEPKSGNQC